MSTSSLTISGNVTNDPELTYTASDVARLSFGVAVNYGYTDAKGEKQEKTSYFNVTAWRYLAENTGRVLEKGMGVIVHGRLEQRSYEDKEGNKRSAVDLIADEIGVATRSIESVERRKRTEGGPASAQSQPRVAQKSAARTKPSVPAGAGASDEPF